jgi:hypothetical protein
MVEISRLNGSARTIKNPAIRTGVRGGVDVTFREGIRKLDKKTCFENTLTLDKVEIYLPCYFRNSYISAELL